jgi:hypothetical protein
MRIAISRIFLSLYSSGCNAHKHRVYGVFIAKSICEAVAVVDNFVPPCCMANVIAKLEFYGKGYLVF